MFGNYFSAVLICFALNSLFVRLGGLFLDAWALTSNLVQEIQ